MKIFVTGGCGFIGSNFILNNVKSEKTTIINLDKLTYAGNLDNLKSIENLKNYHFINGDITNIKYLNTIFKKYKPDILIHFAAESHVDRSIDQPLDFVQTNVVGTVTILEAALIYWNQSQNKKFKLLHISTDEVFGSLGNDGLFTEQTPYNPNSPYSASKASSDHFVRAWCKTYGLPSIITNCSNNYGPYQFPEKLIPLIIANCIDEKALPIYGEGLNIRDWLFVNDHCDAIMTVIKKGRIGETYNIGGNNEIRNIDIVNKICSVLDDKKPRSNGQSYKKLITYVKDRPGHDFRYAIDTAKINDDLGWAPKENFDSGIYKTINWYLENEVWWRNIQKINYNQERLGLKK